MALIKLWMSLTVLIMSQTVTLFALPDDANIWKAQARTQHANKEAHVEVVYENYSDSMLPLLSRDLTLLGQAVDMIRNNECRYQCKSMLDGIRNLTSWAVRCTTKFKKFINIRFLNMYIALDYAKTIGVKIFIDDSISF